MFFSNALAPGPLMAEPKAKKDPTVAAKLRKETKRMLDDLAEAKGLHLWQVVDELVLAVLEPEWRAAQPRLKQIRAQKERIAAIQREARKQSAG